MNTTLEFDAIARFGHALSDPTRVKILMMLTEQPCYPADMATNIQVTRQSISNHLACLKGCGLVNQDTRGRRVQYRLSDAKLNHALLDLRDVVLKTDPEVCKFSIEKECC